MKKIKIPAVFFMFLSLSLMAFSPSDTKADYQDLEKCGPALFLNEEVGSFTQAETSHTTEDQTVWNNRYKTWTELMSSSTIAQVEQAILRN